MEEGNMGNGRCQRSEAQPVRDGKEDTEIELAVIIVLVQVDVKRLGVENAGDVVAAARPVIRLVGHDRELLGVEDVAPIEDREGHVDNEDEPHEHVDDGEGRGGERRAQEGDDGVPVEGECTDPHAAEARADLLGGDRVLPNKAHDREVRERLEEVAGQDGVGEAADQDEQEELEPRGASLGPPLLFMQCPDQCFV